MSELNTNLVIELSEAELDQVAGGLAISIGDAAGFAQSAANDFFKKSLTVAQKTVAGPEGSGTMLAFNLDFVGSSAGQSISIG